MSSEPPLIPPAPPPPPLPTEEETPPLLALFSPTRIDRAMELNHLSVDEIMSVYASALRDPDPKIAMAAARNIVNLGKEAIRAHSTQQKLSSKAVDPHTGLPVTATATRTVLPTIQPSPPPHALTSPTTLGRFHPPDAPSFPSDPLPDSPPPEDHLPPAEPLS